MFDSLQNLWQSPRWQQLTDVRNIGLYIFGVIVLAITWSGVKTVQTNYDLQKQISTLKQQNEVLNLKNQNAYLQNQYLGSNEFLDLAARQNLALAAPGEQLLLIPKNVAMKYVDPSLSTQVAVSTNSNPSDSQSKAVKNMEDWRDFLLGRKLFSD